MISEQQLPVFTFGWELEAIGRADGMVKDVNVGHDGSVGGEGLEYRINRNAVFDPERSLRALRALLALPGIEVDKSCGFHVHVGLGMKTRKLQAWAANYVTLARLVETEAFEAVPKSRRENQFCRSWKENTGSVIAPEYSRSKHSNGTRYLWVNPVEIFRPGGIRTIEVRLMGHSQNYLYLLSWTSFCRKMAASAWALTHDPSRLQQEVEACKQTLKLIKDCFVVNCIAPKEKAKLVVSMAMRAGFYGAFTPTLAKLRERERNLRYEMDADAAERDQYDRQIASIRSYIAHEGTILSASSEALSPGDIVEALGVDPNAYTIPGRQYEVERDNPHAGVVVIRGIEGGLWPVPRSLMCIIKRRETVCVA